MNYAGDFPLGATFDVKFTSRRFTTGAPFALAGGTVEAYVDNNTTQISAGITLTADFDTVTGLNNVRVVATGGNGYAAGSSYALVLTAGSVDSVSVVGEVVASFTLERSAAFGRLGAPAGASVSADIAAVKAETASIQSDTNDIQTRLPAALVGGRIDASVGAMAAGVVTAAAIATDAIDADALAADAVTEIQTGLATSAALATVQADTDDIQTRLPAALVGGRMDTSVGAMAAGVVTAAAVATNAIDADALATDAVNEIVDQVWDEVLAGHLTAGTTGKALSDASGIAPTVGAIADAVWDEARAGHVAAGSFGEGVPVISIAAGAITAAAVATGAIDADALATDAVNEIADGLLNRDMSLVSDTNARTPLNALRFLRNKWSVVAGVLTVTEEDDTTTAWTAATTGTAGADPITTVDPA